MDVVGGVCLLVWSQPQPFFYLCWRARAAPCLEGGAGTDGSAQGAGTGRAEKRAPPHCMEQSRQVPSLFNWEVLGLAPVPRH